MWGIASWLQSCEGRIDPGVIDTDMQAYIRESSEADFPQVGRFIRRKQEGGLVSPDTVASSMLEVLARADLVAGSRYELSCS